MSKSLLRRSNIFQKNFRFVTLKAFVFSPFKEIMNSKRCNRKNENSVTFIMTNEFEMHNAVTKLFSEDFRKTTKKKNWSSIRLSYDKRKDLSRIYLHNEYTAKCIFMKLKLISE